MLKFRFFAIASLLACAGAPLGVRAETTTPFEIQLPACPPPVARVHLYESTKAVDGLVIDLGGPQRLVVKTDPNVSMTRDADGKWIFQRTGDATPVTLSVAEATRLATFYSTNVRMKRDIDGSPIMLLYSEVSTPCKMPSARGTILLTPPGETL